MIIDFIDENDTIETIQKKIQEFEIQLFNLEKLNTSISNTYGSELCTQDMINKEDNINTKIEVCKMHIEYLKGDFTDMTSTEL